MPNNKITLIGSSMIDYYGKSYQPLLDDESNPGFIQTVAGGVARNIAQNLVQLQANCTLISAFGNDLNAKWLQNDCREKNISIQNSYFSNQYPQSSYLALLEPNGDMKIAVSDLTILEAMPSDFILHQQKVINESKMIVCDTVLSQNVLKTIVDTFAHIPILVDPVSICLCEKIKPFIGQFHTLKCNRNEAEVFYQKSIKTNEDLQACGQFLINKGLKQIFITLGEKGVYVKTLHEEYFFDSKPTLIINASGAGDAFSAGVAYGFAHDLPLFKTIELALVLAQKTLTCIEAVNDTITLEQVMKGN